MFAQRGSRLSTPFSESIPVVKRRMTVSCQCTHNVRRMTILSMYAQCPTHDCILSMYAQCPTHDYPVNVRTMSDAWLSCQCTHNILSHSSHFMCYYKNVLLDDTWARGLAVLLRHCTTSWKVAGSIPEGVFGIFSLT